MVTPMDETHLSTETPTPTKGARTPRKRELKNLTKRDGVWYFHKRVNGKKEFNGRKTPFSLETRDLAVAKAKRDALLKAANGAEIDRILGRHSRPLATIGEVCIAYRKAPTVRASAATRERNIADLERLIRLVKGAEFAVAEASTELLTKALVKEWQALRLAAAQAAHAGDLPALEAAKRSLNSTLTHVQSLFSREALDDYGALHLPANVQEFAAALPVAARRQEEPTQLTDALVTELLAKVETMRGEDPGAWTAFQLMTWGGLRNKECLHARESWLEEIPGAGAWRLQLKPAADFLPKGNSRHVVLPAATVQAILAQLPAAELVDGAAVDRHLVPGKHPTDRHAAIYRRLNQWLKAHGVTEDAQKIAYRLRKYFLAKVAAQQGVLFSQAAAGHSSLATTRDHYIGTPKMAEPIRLPGTGQAS